MKPELAKTRAGRITQMVLGVPALLIGGAMLQLPRPLTKQQDDELNATLDVCRFTIVPVLREIWPSKDESKR